MTPGLIVNMHGAAVNVPRELTHEELELVLRCFGLNRKSALATRNRFALGAGLAKDDPKAVLAQSMSDMGMIRMVMDASKLVASKKWKGDISKATLVVHVLPYGVECLKYTLKTSNEARAMAQKAAKA